LKDAEVAAKAARLSVPKDSNDVLPAALKVAAVSSVAASLVPSAAQALTVSVLREAAKIADAIVTATDLLVRRAVASSIGNASLVAEKAAVLTGSVSQVLRRDVASTASVSRVRPSAVVVTGIVMHAVQNDVVQIVIGLPAHPSADDMSANAMHAAASGAARIAIASRVLQARPIGDEWKVGAELILIDIAWVDPVRAI
jgi:hypothetical protein